MEGGINERAKGLRMSERDDERREEHPFDKRQSGTLKEDLRQSFSSQVCVDAYTSEGRFFHSFLGGALRKRYGKPRCEVFQRICRTATDEHMEIAVTCLNYLEYFAVPVPRGRQSEKFFRNTSRNLPFLKYAGMRWPQPWPPS